METEKYSMAVFYHVSHIFDKIWHDGLLYKTVSIIKKIPI